MECPQRLGVCTQRNVPATRAESSQDCYRPGQEFLRAGGTKNDRLKCVDGSNMKISTTTLSAFFNGVHRSRLTSIKFLYHSL